MRRILVLDDEALIALDLAGVLEDEGFAVCGPYNSVDDALDAIDAHAPDGAILDVIWVRTKPARLSLTVSASTTSPSPF